MSFGEFTQFVWICFLDMTFSYKRKEELSNNTDVVQNSSKFKSFSEQHWEALKKKLLQLQPGMQT